MKEKQSGFAGFGSVYADGGLAPKIEKYSHFHLKYNTNKYQKCPSLIRSYPMIYGRL